MKLRIYAKKKPTEVQLKKIKAFISLFKMTPVKIDEKSKRLTSFEKDDLLDAIRNYWIMNPDLRLCQLISNIAMEEDETRTDLYYYEDRYLLKSLKKKLGKK